MTLTATACTDPSTPAGHRWINIMNNMFVASACFVRTLEAPQNPLETLGAPLKALKVLGAPLASCMGPLRPLRGFLGPYEFD